MICTGPINCSQAVGRNTTQEASKLMSLQNEGLEIQYMETYLDDLTNPQQMQLQHLLPTLKISI